MPSLLIKVGCLAHKSFISWMQRTAQVEAAPNAPMRLKLVQDAGPPLISIEHLCITKDIHTMPCTGEGDNDAIFNGAESEFPSWI